MIDGCEVGVRQCHGYTLFCKC